MYHPPLTDKIWRHNEEILAECLNYNALAKCTFTFELVFTFIFGFVSGLFFGNVVNVTLVTSCFSTVLSTMGGTWGGANLREWYFRKRLRDLLCIVLGAEKEGRQKEKHELRVCCALVSGYSFFFGAPRLHFVFLLSYTRLLVLM